MTLVVDASVAAKWFLKEERHEQALRLLDDRARLLAPDWIVQEIAHVAFKKWRDGEIGAEHARMMVLALPDLVRQLHPSTDLASHALDIAFALRHPVYDCLYIACADVAGGVLVTADAGLCAAVRGTPYAGLVKHLSEWAGA